MADFPETPDTQDDTVATPRRRTGNGPLIAMIVLGLLLVGGLGFALYYFLGKRGGLDTEMLAYLPAETNVVVGGDLEELQKNPKLRDMFAKVLATSDTKDPVGEANERLKATGLTVDDFSKVLVGMDPEHEDAVVVIRTRKSFDRPKMAATMKFTEEKTSGDKTYYVNEKGGRLFFPADTLVVVAPERHLEALIGKDPSQVLLGADMQNLCRKMARGEVWAVFSSLPVSEKFDEDLNMAKKARVPYLPPSLVNLVKDAKAGGFYLRLDDDEIKIVVGLVGANKDQVKQAEKDLEEEIKKQKGKRLEDDDAVGEEFARLPEDARKFIDDVRKSIEVDREGDTLEITFEIDLKRLETLITALMNQQKLEIKRQVDEPIIDLPKLEAIQPEPTKR